MAGVRIAVFVAIARSVVDFVSERCGCNIKGHDCDRLIVVRRIIVAVWLNLVRRTVVTVEMVESPVVNVSRGPLVVDGMWRAVDVVIKTNILAVMRGAVFVVAMKEAVVVDAIGMVFIVVCERSEMCKVQRRIP